MPLFVPDLNDLLERLEDDVVRFDGCDAAIIGLGCTAGRADALVYDRDLLLQLTMDRSGCSHSEASDWIAHNVESMHSGRVNAIIVERFA